MRKKRLDGKVAIVTGAGAHEERELGTGRATAVCLAREGARVLVADLDEANAQRTVDEIQREVGEAMVFQADSTLASDNEAMVAVRRALRGCACLGEQRRALWAGERRGPG